MTTSYTPPVTLTSDADTIGCWPITGASTEPDLGPYNMYITNTYSNADRGAAPGIGVGEVARYISGLSGSNILQPRNSDDFGAAFSTTIVPLMLGEWTMEMMVYLNSGSARWIFMYGGPSLGGIQAANMLGGFWCNGRADGKTQFAMGWMSGNFVWNNSGPWLSPILNTPTTNQWIHVVARKKSAGGGLYDASIWANGVKVAEFLNRTNADGGDSASNGFGLGGWRSVDNTDVNNTFALYFTRAKIYKIALSDAAIVQRYQDSTWQVAGGGSLTFVSASSTANVVTLTFSGTPYLVGDAQFPSKWIVSDVAGNLLTINSVNVVGSTIVINTSAQKTGTVYTVVFPATISSSGGTILATPASATFTGSGISPTIQIVKVVDTRLIDVVFSNPMSIDALNSNLYSVSGGLRVFSVKQLSQSIYRLTTDPQVPGTSYTVTATGIKDIYGNST